LLSPPALYVSKRVTSGTPDAILLLTALAARGREAERFGEFEEYVRAPARNPLRNRERGLPQNHRNRGQKREKPEALTSGFSVNQSDLRSSLPFVWLPARTSEELLVLYKHRARIAPSELELRLGKHVATRASVPCATLTKQGGIERTSANLRGPQRRGRPSRGNVAHWGENADLPQQWRRGGIRTPGTQKGHAGFRNRPTSDVTPCESTTCGSSDSHLASCLALLAEKQPDLAAVVKAWPDLPEAVRAGIVAMVKASNGGAE